MRAFFCKKEMKMNTKRSIAVMILIAFHPAYATNTDWHDDAVSRQVQTDARAEARKIWREEHGDWQPNLTPAAEAELVRYTVQKQPDMVRATQEQ
jgi:hypothetical protein|nr:MAG TPA: hypothetical protein [Bacteriophage sp.]